MQTQEQGEQAGPPTPKGGYSLFFANVPRMVNQDEMRAVFAPFGVQDILLLRSEDGTSSTKGCGLVTMSSLEGATAAIQSLNNKCILPGMMEPMTVKWMDAALEPPVLDQTYAPAPDLNHWAGGDNNMPMGFASAESSSLSSMMAGAAAPHMRAQQAAVQQLAAQIIAAQHMIPQQMATQQIVPQQMTAQQMMPQQIAVAQHVTAQQVAAAQQATAQQVTAQQVAVAQQVTAQQMTESQQAGPSQQITAQQAMAALQMTVAQQGTGQQMAPLQMTAQQVTAAQHMTAPQAIPQQAPAAADLLTADWVRKLSISADSSAAQAPDPEPESQEPPEPPPEGCDPDAFKLFVGNIPTNYTEDTLRPFFEWIGPVVELFVVRDRTQKSKGSAFVWYACRDAAERAIEHYNERLELPAAGGQPALGKPLVIRKAKPRAKPSARQLAAASRQQHAGQSKVHHAVAQGLSHWLDVEQHSVPSMRVQPSQSHDTRLQALGMATRRHFPPPTHLQLSIPPPMQSAAMPLGFGAVRGGALPESGASPQESQLVMAVAISKEELPTIINLMGGMQAVSGAHLTIMPGHSATGPGAFHLLASGDARQVGGAVDLLKGVLDPLSPRLQLLS